MPRSSPWEDGFTLLCERCGYVLEGLKTEGSCPECGSAIRRSLPEWRVGSPWQIDPSLRTLLWTACITVLRPRRTLDFLHAAPKRDRWLFRFYSLGAGLPVALILGVLGIGVTRDLGVQTLGPRGDFAILFFVTLLLIHGLLSVLVLIERRGLAFLSALRGTRVTPAYARSITSHGSVGWLLGSWWMCLIVVLDISINPHAITELRLTTIASGAAAMLLGFFFFEVFAYLGLRRLRYANRVRPEHESDRSEPTIEHA